MRDMKHDEVVIDSGLGFFTVEERDHISFVVDSMTRRGLKWSNGRTCAFFATLGSLRRQVEESDDA